MQKNVIMPTVNTDMRGEDETYNVKTRYLNSHLNYLNLENFP